MALRETVGLLDMTSFGKDSGSRDACTDLFTADVRHQLDVSMQDRLYADAQD